MGYSNVSEYNIASFANYLLTMFMYACMYVCVSLNFIHGLKANSCPEMTDTLSETTILQEVSGDSLISSKQLADKYNCDHQTVIGLLKKLSCHEGVSYSVSFVLCSFPFRIAK